MHLLGGSVETLQFDDRNKRPDGLEADVLHASK
jgi:hypothetical protein